MAFIMLFSACESEDYLDFAGGSTIKTATNPNVPGFFDIVSLSSSQSGFSLMADDASAQAVNSVTVFKSLNGGDLVEHASGIALPADLSFTLDEVCSGLGIASSDVVAGDAFTFVFDLATSAGTFRSAETVTINAACASDLSGTYSRFSDILYTDYGPVQYDDEITLTDLGGGNYEIEDITGGAWGIWYVGYYGTSPRTTTITDVCGTLSVAPVSDQFCCEILVDEITFDPETGVIFYHWYDTGYADEGNVTLTPQ